MGDCHDLSDVVSLDRGDLLYRRIHHSHKDNVRAGLQTERWREGLSCDWALLTTLEQVVKERPGYALSISVGDCLDLNLEVHYCPVIDPADPHYPNYAHCLLILPEDVSTKSQIEDLRQKFLSRINRHEVASATTMELSESPPSVNPQPPPQTEPIESSRAQPAVPLLARFWRWLLSLFR